MNTYLLIFVMLAVIGVQLPNTFGYTETDELEAWPKYQGYGYPAAYERYVDYRKRGLRNMRMGKRSAYQPMKSVPTE
ncbi:unnamed protein product [Heterobilharzia americana]|nr:unnamed protein product [Heterobilharzia americana]